jgi:hypothetical protein
MSVKLTWYSAESHADRERGFRYARARKPQTRSLLEEQILAVNSEIKILNKENHQEAPEFNSDLYRTSNRQKKTYAGFQASIE